MEKNYLGNAWEESNSSTKSTFYNVQLDKEKIESIEPNLKGYVSVSLTKRRNPDERTGATHSLYEPLKSQGLKDDFVEISFSFLKEEALQCVNSHNKIQLTISPVDKLKAEEKGITLNSDFVVSTNNYNISDNRNKIIGNGWDMANQLEISGAGWQKEHEGKLFYNVSLQLEKIEKMPANEKGYINLTIAPKNQGEDEKAPSHVVYKTIGLKDENGIINISILKDEALKNHNGQGSVMLNISKVEPSSEKNYDYLVKAVEFKNQNVNFDKNKAAIGNGWDRGNTVKKEKKAEAIEEQNNDVSPEPTKKGRKSKKDSNINI